jgi:hypothetical protein
MGLEIAPDTSRNGGDSEFDLGSAVSAIWDVVTATREPYDELASSAA